MGFFDEVVADAERSAAKAAARRSRRPPPEDWNVLAATVPFEKIIWRGRAAAAAIGSVTATPSGFEFVLYLRWYGQDPDEMNDRHDESAYTVGLILSDGREVTAGHYGTSPGEPELLQRGMSGSGMPYGASDLRYRATPLPPPGRLVLVFGWRTREATGAAPVHVELDADAIRAAAGRAQRFLDELPFSDHFPHQGQA